MTNDRPLRIASLLKDEISFELVRNLDASKFGLVSITAVEVNPKLTVAKVFVHSSKKNGELVKAIERTTHSWVKSVQKRLTLRRCPQFVFMIDQSVRYVDHIDELLREIKKK